jgi:hypothetical protein
MASVQELNCHAVYNHEMGYEVQILQTLTFPKKYIKTERRNFGSFPYKKRECISILNAFVAVFMTVLHCFYINLSYKRLADECYGCEWDQVEVI